jgi:ion channel-forming bestrophin family protein
MADEAMAAPTSGAPPAATDHEFSSHNEQPTPLPMHNTSRKSTISKSFLDVHVTGTQTPMSVNGHHAHSHLGEIAIENYFVYLPTLQFSWQSDVD